MNKSNTAAERLDIARLQSLLETHYFGRADHLIYEPSMPSTNMQAMQLARQGIPEGTVVLTDNQTAGKGRQGRRWVDAAGCNAITSLILRPVFAPYLLVMVASLAVLDAIAQVCKLTASIKWPNDVLIAERKVAGILIETSRDQHGQMVAIMGIGVNVNRYSASSDVQLTPDEVALTSMATHLETACGQRINREVFIAALLRFLEQSYQALQDEVLRPASVSSNNASASASRLLWERWRSQLSTLGRTIQVRQGANMLSGVAEDVNDSGELLLRLHSGEQVSITWGDIGYPTA